MSVGRMFMRALSLAGDYTVGGCKCHGLIGIPGTQNCTFHI